MAFYRLSAFADEASDVLDEQIAALKRNNIPCIELRGTEAGPIDLVADKTAKEIAAKLKDAGIGISAVGSRLGKSEIGKPYGASLESLKRLCEICHILGTDRIRMFSYFIPREEKPADYREEVLRRMRGLVAYAQSEGVLLCHENEARIYGELPENVLDLHQNVPGLGGVYDPSNYRMADADFDFALEKVMPYADYLHVKDCTASHVIVPAGEGDGRLAEMFLRHNELHEGASFITLEPHLFAFTGYKDIDDHELKNKYHFNNKQESFDFAANALKALLTKIGFREGEQGWTK